MLRSKTALKALVAAAALAVPVGLMVPAQANSSSGCTVVPLTPQANGTIDVNGNKMVDYKMTVVCSIGRTIHITDSRWEDDPVGGDDATGTSFIDRDYTQVAGNTTITVTRALPDTDDLFDNYEEVYHRVHFTVSSNGVTSPFTAWQYSGVRAIQR
jgi:hypothetical protein